MKKLLIIILAGLILLNAFGNVAAQEDDECDDDSCDDDGDCITCRDNSFYYVLMIGLIIFAVFFYLRNKEKIG